MSVRVKSDICKDINGEFQANGEYVYGKILNLRQYCQTFIYKYNILFAIGVAHDMNVHLVEVCEGEQACAIVEDSKDNVLVGLNRDNHLFDMCPNNKKDAFQPSSNLDDSKSYATKELAASQHMLPLGEREMHLMTMTILYRRQELLGSFLCYSSIFGT